MPWKETRAMDQKFLFVKDCEAGWENLSELCRRYGISRPTGYRWMDRYRAEGVEGLRERSRAAKQHPNAVAPEVVEAILELRERYGYGPRKLRRKLADQRPGQKPPARSTIGAVIERHGWAKKPNRKSRVHSYPQGLTEPMAPNQVWGADFKGWFKTGDGRRCDPLTVTDLYSRYLICVQVVPRVNSDCVRLVLEDCFKRYGLPQSIRTDNGPPFAGRGAGGLSGLSLWWTRLGIRVERIQPGRPQQNARHERFHKTLKESTASPAASSLQAQQMRFDAFQLTYNEQRPHEALADRYPAEVYQPSARRYPTALRPIEYPPELPTRLVGTQGEIYWRNQRLFLTYLLTGERVALKRLDQRYYQIVYGPAPLALLDAEKGQLIRRPQRIRKTLKAITKKGGPDGQK